MTEVGLKHTCVLGVPSAEVATHSGIGVGGRGPKALWSWSHPSLQLTPPSLWSLNRAAKKFNILLPLRSRLENDCQHPHLRNVGGKRWKN